MKAIIQHALIVFILVCNQQTFAQKVIPLRINDTPGIYTITKGEKVEFAVQLRKGQCYEIRVEQKAIDLSLSLKKNGNIISYHDSTNGSYGPEVIRYLSTSNENNTLEINRIEEAGNADTGSFSIVVRRTLALDDNTYITSPYLPAQMTQDLGILRAIRDSANPGLYRYRTKQQIDSIYRWAYTQVTKPLAPLAFYRIITVLADFEGSCHNWTGMPYDIKYYLPRQKGFFPYNLRYVEGKLIVNNTSGQIPLGARIMRIDGIVDSVIMQRLYKYRTTDGYNLTQKQFTNINRRFGIKYQIEFGIKDRFIIQYTLPGSTQLYTVKLKSISMEEDKKNYLQRHSMPLDKIVGDVDVVQNKYSFAQVNDSSALLTIRAFDMADGDEDPAYKVYCHFLDSIFVWMNSGNRIKHLIVDIRNNPGGNDPNFEKAFSYLANHSFKENNFAYTIFNRLPFPQYYDWSSEDKENQQRDQQRINHRLQEVFSVVKDEKYFQNQQYNPIWYPDNDRFKGKIYLLINDLVASAASHFASLIKSYSDVKVIGIETVGGYYSHNGHIPVKYVLPHTQMKTQFSIVVVEQDALKIPSQPFGHGVIPDYHVQQSFDDFINNRDTQMEFTLERIGDKR